MTRIFNDFSEVENEITQRVPKTVYKYRNWDDSNHRRLLTDNEIWFAHPKTLNDQYDIRVPFRFDFEEVNHPVFFLKLKELLRIHSPQIPYPSIAFDAIAKQRLKIIKQDPGKWFNDRYKEIREGDLFDTVGLFSLSVLPDNELMWAHYGNNNKGVCIGFNTVELLRDLRMGFGFVDYTNEPIPHSVINPINIKDKDEFYFKHSKWNYEKEFRILTSAISNVSQRLRKIKKEAIAEVILGIESTIEVESEIIKLLRSKYNSNVKLFKVEASVHSFGFKLNEVVY